MSLLHTEIMKILFVVKEKNDLDFLIEMYEKPRREMDNKITFLLIHDAVLAESISNTDFKVFACNDDVKARGIDTLFNTLDYVQMLKLMADCDKVICW
jgi:sulfur relay protein TusB/DsrH